jgi:hypothetical protein
MTTEPIRRRSNGTIDIDFYRARALSERAAAMSDVGNFINRTVKKITHGIRSLMLTAPRPRRLPDPGVMMLIAQATTKRPQI